jgi:hypothetical protein
VQFTRLAQLQAEIEATRRALDSMTHRHHRR